MWGRFDMGDVFLTYDETGRAYFRRLVVLNILALTVFAFIFVVTTVDIIVVILPAAFVAGASLVYALFFISKNPPIEPEEDYSSES
jgi:hypothetical protein